LITVPLQFFPKATQQYCCIEILYTLVVIR